MLKKIFPLALLLLIACTQEISSGVQPSTTEFFVEPTVVPIENPILAATDTPALIEFSPAQPLPNGPISMIAIGDSLTQGDGDDTGRGYPGRLLEIINGLRPDSTMTNFGQSGWNTNALIDGDQGFLGQLPRAVDEVKIATSQARGAVVFVWIGSNDLWYLYEYNGDVNDEQENQDLQNFSTNIDITLSQLRNAGAQVIIALLDDQSKRPVALRGEAFTEITPDELNRMAVHVQRYNDIITQKANQYGALTVNFYNTDIFTNPATLYDDGNHPNANGYDIITQKWLEALQIILP